MICRRCLQRASSLRPPLTTTPRSFTLPIRRTISSTTPVQEPAAAASSTTTSTTPPAAESTPISSCPEGTILKGLNYFKNKVDPVALADDAYPPWLWKCLDVQKKVDDEGEADAGDEFSKSKKQRRLAAKRQRLYEARLIAEGNLEALAPKIPLQHQSINLPANEENTTEGALRSIEARQELTRAMRRERKAKIKESNYLKSM
ncbi:mitochondrial ribosomal protein L37-domain-containing protein [Xylariaceae sp. FL1272]|nr:mitochondrial ribosomal protein L37-domain-containing protein [Xylariaceae sp. FL1272]